MKCSLNADKNTIMSDEKIILNNDIQKLIETRDSYSKQISRLDILLKDAKTRLEMYTKNRRIGEEWIYTSVNKIFQKFGANRAPYFGCAFEGVDIWKIMASSNELFGVGGEV